MLWYVLKAKQGKIGIPITTDHHPNYLLKVQIYTAASYMCTTKDVMEGRGQVSKSNI